ncbi:MAG: hypothetical protein ACLFUS_01440, partial [Candidatus Sumerlaeia bacterium]
KPRPIMERACGAQKRTAIPFEAFRIPVYQKSPRIAPIFVVHPYFPQETFSLPFRNSFNYDYV